MSETAAPQPPKKKKKKRKPLSKFTRPFRFWILRRVLLPIVFAIVWLWMKSWRLEIETPDVWTEIDAASPENPIAIAGFHETLLGFAGMKLLIPKDSRVRPVALVSPSRDGELMGDFLHRIGWESTSGSTKSKSLSGIRALGRAMADGAIPCITVDGPRGPRGAPKPGVFAVARIAKGKIYAGHMMAGSAIRFRKSWDKAVLPLPFSKIRARFEFFHDYTDGADLANERAALQAVMLKLMDEMDDDTSEIQRLAAPEQSGGET